MPKIGIIVDSEVFNFFLKLFVVEEWQIFKVKICLKGQNCCNIYIG